MEKFNPIKCGFVESSNEEETEYLLIKDFKVKGRIFYLSMIGTWYAYKTVHCVDGSTKEHEVYKGRISDNKFAKELFKNIF